jgi:hypothetical protein
MKRPQITLRAALILVALVAVSIGWMADRYRLKQENSELRQRLQELTVDAVRPLAA